MCFSATASFGAGAALLVAGTFIARKAEKPNQLAFAGIPLLFAVQQIAEGFVWLSLTHEEYSTWSKIPVYTFLFFAHILWPSWISFSMLLLEKNLLRRKILCSILSIGLTLSLSEIYCIWAYPLRVSISGHHVEYDISFPPIFISITNILYGVVTFIPCFISTVKKMWVFGVTLIVSFIVSRIFYAQYVVSVWCFFAAFLSAVIYFILPYFKKNASNAIISVE